MDKPQLIITPNYIFNTITGELYVHERVVEKYRVKRSIRNNTLEQKDIHSKIVIGYKKQGNSTTYAANIRFLKRERFRSTPYMVAALSGDYGFGYWFPQRFEMSRRVRMQILNSFKEMIDKSFKLKRTKK